MTKEIVHSVILIIAIVVGFLLPKTFLVNYEPQLLGVIFIVFYLLRKKILKDENKKRLLDSVVFTFVVISIIASTNYTQSPFFFLVYFLIFSLSLLLEPVISMVVALTLIGFFVLSLPEGQDFVSLLPIISLAFITPFSLFLGKEYEENQRLRIKNQTLKKDQFFFLNLLIKNHLKNIKTAIENFLGDQELQIIKHSVFRIEKLIEKYEKTNFS
ncbi:MAG: hypothetical protein NZL96_01880 [Patescibacteria group bacterium]|nr:hypothetical protein [Patescibacteria group bacterium]